MTMWTEFQERHEQGGMEGTCRLEGLRAGVRRHCVHRSSLAQSYKHIPEKALQVQRPRDRL